MQVFLEIAFTSIFFVVELSVSYFLKFRLACLALKNYKKKNEKEKHRTENHATKVTKKPKTKLPKYGMSRA